jgi:hypothetical protein
MFLAGFVFSITLGLDFLLAAVSILTVTSPV